MKKTYRKSILHTFISIVVGVSLFSCDGDKKPAKVEKVGNPDIQKGLAKIPVAAMANSCAPDFVQNVPKFANYPDGIRDCNNHKQDVLPLCVDVYYAIYPGSAWETPKGAAALKAELTRARDWYAAYCIYISFIPVPINDPKKRAKMAKDYKRWDAANPKQNITSAQGKVYQANIVAGLYKEVIKTSKKHLAILCFDRHYFFASSGKSSRITPGSGTYTPDQIIGLDNIEIGSTHIVTHELIHAFGKPVGGGIGTYSWFHDCACANAMSTATRKNPKLPFNKPGTDKLDYAEYVDFVTSKQLKRCK